MLSLTQIIAIAHNEFRAQWRRRGMAVLTLSMMALPIAGAFLMRSSLVTVGGEWVEAGAMTTLETQRLIARTIVPTIWAPLYVVLALILPILTADSVPRDRQTGSATGWGELLDSLPLRGGVYLLGKLCGIWLSVFAGCLVAMLLTGISWHFILGPFELKLYLQEWLFGAAALGFLNGGLSMLLAAPLPTPRRAVAVGVLISLASLVMLTLTPIIKHNIPIDLWDHLNIARPVLFVYFFMTTRSIGSVPFGANTTGLDVAWTILAGLLEIALCGLASWFWIYRRKVSS